MVRPKKIPRNFVPVEWTDTEYSDTDTDTITNTNTNSERPEIDLESDTDDGILTEIEQDIPTDYTDEIEKFAEEWLSIEMAHDVSKCASDKFWNAAKLLLKLPSHTKFPSFTHVRRRLTCKYLSLIHI